MYTYNDEKALVAQGAYEVMIERMEVKTLSTGREKITIMYRILDIDQQKFANKCLFEDIWEEKLNPGIFNRKRINQLLGTQKIKEGTTFEDINAIIDFMLGKRLIVNVDIEFDDYNKEDRNVVKFYKSSKYLITTPVTPVEDDDLPF